MEKLKAAVWVAGDLSLRKSGFRPGGSTGIHFFRPLCLLATLDDVSRLQFRQMRQSTKRDEV